MNEEIDFAEWLLINALILDEKARLRALPSSEEINGVTVAERLEWFEQLGLKVRGAMSDAAQRE